MTSPVCSEAISRTVRAETSLRGQQSRPGHAHGWRSARSSHLERPHPQSPAIRNGASTSNQQTDRHGSCTSVSRRQSDAHLRLEHTGVRHGARTSNDLAHNHLRFGQLFRRLSPTESGCPCWCRIRLPLPSSQCLPAARDPLAPPNSARVSHPKLAGRPVPTSARSTHLGLKAPVRRTPRTGKHRRSARSSHLERPRPQSPAIRNGARTSNQQTDQHGPRTSVSRRQSDAHLRLENTGVRHGARTSNDLAHNHLRFGTPWRSPHLESAD